MVVAFADGFPQAQWFGSLFDLISMAVPVLKRLSAAIFSALGQALDGSAAWLRKRPALASWVFPAEDQASEYRRFNVWSFSRFSQQEQMLADGPRMAFYQEAIRREVRAGDRVIDLGTGTGILAALASRQGARQVYALDHSDILQHARELAAHNRLTAVDFVAIHSRDYDASGPVDVILHEQMGDFLFDEAMVANVIDLRDRLLKPGGRIVPSRFELYCEPVKVRDDRRIPFIWELKVLGYDYSPLAWHRPQEPRYYRHNGTDLSLIEHFVGTPSPALTFDLHTLQADQLPREIRLTRTVTHPGRIDGFVVYFRTLAGDDLALSSSPLDPGRAPHWGFPILRTEFTPCAEGDHVELTLTVKAWDQPDTWRWQHRIVPAGAPD